MRNDKNPIRIATRQSQLALRQAEMVRDALLNAHPDLSPDAVQLLPMTTAGDRDLENSPKQWGLKGMFTKEIEDALLSGAADLAVHSMKDMPSQLPEGLMLAAMLPRDDARDAFISVHHSHFDALPQGAVVGCSSVRRSALIKKLRPDLQLVPFRGNVNTRLAKLHDGIAQATILAMAGLNRLALSAHARHPFAPEQMLPAVGQGAIGIECRSDDSAILKTLAAINHVPTFAAVSCERVLLEALDGSCHTPLCGHATLNGDRIHLHALLIHPLTHESWEECQSTTRNEAHSMARHMADSLIARSGWRHWPA